jgi:hypothetical protein
MACGTQYTAPAAGVWYSTNYIAGPGQVNAVAATSDVFRLTGVTLLGGPAAPSAANSPFVIRPYDQELLLCSRYLQYNRNREYGFYQGGNVLVFNHIPVVPYRANPTLSLTTTSVAYENLPWAAGYTMTGCTVSGGHVVTVGFDYQITGTGGGSGATVGSPATIVSDRIVKFDARL